MSTTRSYGKVATGLLAVALSAVSLAACSASPKNVSACESATTNVVAAQADVDQAQAALALQPVNPRVGTPEVAHVQAARADLTKAQGNLDSATTAKATACKPAPTPTQTPASTPSPSPSVDTSVLTGVIKDALTAAGFTDGQYTVNKVDPAADTSTAAAQAFQKDKKLQSAADVVQFLSSGTPQAEAVIAEAIKQTSATPCAAAGGAPSPTPSMAPCTTRDELLNSANWIPVQFTGVSVQWGGNTYYADGVVKNETGAGSVDQAGTTAVIFVPPQQVAAGKVTSIFVLRGACGNPQTMMPRPYVPPTTTSTTTTPTTSCTQPWYAFHAGYYQIAPCVWRKTDQSLPVLRDGGTTGGKQSTLDQSTSGAYVGPTTSNGTPVTEPSSNPVAPANTASPAPAATGGYNGGSTTQPGQTGTPAPGPTQPPVSSDSGGF